jgi:hypothetical protein
MHGAPLAGNPNNFQNWMHDLAGAGGQVLGDARVNVQMMQQVNEEIVPGNLNQGNQGMQPMEVDQMEEDVMENAVPQHPDQPQDTISFNQSGSTATYLRATRPDIHLSVEEVLAGIQNSQNGSVSSNDSEVVSSERMANVIVPDFIIRACRMLPVDSVLPMTNGLPNPRVADWKEDIQKAIVPVQPVMGYILLKLLAAHVEMPMVRELISIPTVVTKRPGAKTPLMDTWVRLKPRNQCPREGRGRYRSLIWVSPR